MPRISIIIPNHNSARHLRRCLRALKRNPLEGHEVIVVDDGSTDNSASSARRHGAKTIVLNSNSGPATARNMGASRATGEILWFLDADIEAPADAIAQIERFFIENIEVAAVIGSYDSKPAARGPVSQFKNLFHHFVHQSNPANVSTFWSGCGAVRRHAFVEVGGFDAEYWRRPMIEDIHFGAALTRHGFETRILKSLQVRHHKRWTLANLIKTDIFDRAVPWTVMLLRNRGIGAGDLNLRWPYRISVATVWLALPLLLAGLWKPWIWLGAGAALTIPLVCNLPLLRLFRRKRGWPFLIAAVPLLWLYFFYCGVGFLLGVLLFAYERISQRRLFQKESEWDRKYQD